MRRFIKKNLAPFQASIHNTEMWRLILLSFLCFGCALNKGFVAGDQAPEGIKKPLPLVTNAADCRSHSGVWRGFNKPEIFPNGGYCQFRAGDSGKLCKSSHDCEGYCEVSYDERQENMQARCSAFLPPRWDRCVPGYFENGKILGRGECFGDDAEVQ